MKAYAYILAALMAFSFAYAVEDHSGERSVDDKTSLCEASWISGVCEGFTKAVDTTNKFIEDALLSGLDNSDTVRDTELVLLEEEKAAATSRVGQGWNNILSVIYLVLEVVKILFFAIQIFILVHIPYLYVKMLVWIKKMAIGAVNRRSER